MNLSLLKRCKLALCRLHGQTGLPNLLLSSRWRDRRLLIIGYHGFAQDDEYSWSPLLYPQAAFLRRRLECLRELKCNVISLDEAVSRLFSNSLPPRSVVLTFDDGLYSFHDKAFPLLREFGYPATVYLNTYYSTYNRPVFTPALDYVLWKGRGRTLIFHSLWNGPVPADEQNRILLAQGIVSATETEDLSAQAKDELLSDIARQLGLDYEAICRRRILHLMTAGEVSEIARQGVAIELHTHGHRVSRIHARFIRELEDNSTAITEATGKKPRHFCYPGGLYFPEFPNWLRDSGVLSATTCRPDLCSPHDSPWLLPRLIDAPNVAREEFTAWVSGFAGLLPHRKHVPHMGQLFPDERTVTEGTVGETEPKEA